MGSAQALDTASMERVLITGGMGFLGTHLCERLLQAGREVWALDLFEPPHAKRLREYERFHLVVDTIKNKQTLQKLVDKCDLVCHLAAVACPEQYVNQTRKTIDIGLLSGIDVIEMVRMTGKKLFFTSTSEVYGRNPKVPWSEDDDRVLGSVDVSRWCYSTSKAVLEHYIRACHMEGQLDFLMVRVFNCYGPRLRGRVLDRFIDSSLRGEPMTIHGDGLQTRCFTYVDDLIDGVVRLLSTPSAWNETYNIGNPDETTILELAQHISQATGNTEANIEFVSHEQAIGKSYEDIPRRVPDITRIRRAIGWKPTTDLRTGLAQTIAYRSQELGLTYV